MFKVLSSLIAFALAATLAVPALGASGTAVGVDPDAEARGKQARTLVVGSDVFIGDRVVTGPSGLVQILFSDKTKLVVGPRSALLLEDYLLREDGSAGKFAVTTLSGTFRFITGNSPKNRYVINTPSGTVGVRGTAFDLFVTKALTRILQLHGSTINCSNSGDCETLDSKCDYGIMSNSEVDVLGSSRELDSDEREEASELFLAGSQGGLMRPFRVSGAESCFKRAAQTMEAPASLSDPFIAKPRPSRRNDNDDDDNGNGDSDGGDTPCSQSIC
jgi:hypothetical protein